MMTPQQTLDAYFPEMRWRCLSLAADLDRVQRAAGPNRAILNDNRLVQLQRALQVLLSEQGDRAEKVQMVFSDPIVSKPL